MLLTQCYPTVSRNRYWSTTHSKVCVEVASRRLRRKPCTAAHEEKSPQRTQRSADQCRISLSLSDSVQAKSKPKGILSATSISMMVMSGIIVLKFGDSTWSSSTKRNWVFPALWPRHRRQRIRCRGHARGQRRRIFERDFRRFGRIELRLEYAAVVSTHRWRWRDAGVGYDLDVIHVLENDPGVDVAGVLLARPLADADGDHRYNEDEYDEHGYEPNPRRFASRSWLRSNYSDKLTAAVIEITMAMIISENEASLTHENYPIHILLKQQWLHMKVWRIDYHLHIVALLYYLPS